MRYPKELTAKNVAELLENIAAVYQIKGENRFRIRAYQNAAAGIKHSAEDLSELWQQSKLESVPGVGASIAQHLDELFRKGKVRHFETVTGGFPDGFFELLKVPGIGPKTAFKLAKRFKLNRAEDALLILKQKAERGEIRMMPGFAEETEKSILENVCKVRQKPAERMLLPEAQAYADSIIAYMKKGGLLTEIEALGSLRRQAPTVGDIDLAVKSDKTRECLDYFIKYPQVKKVLAKGSNTARILVTNNTQVDLKVVKPAAYGSLLQHFTGSKQHNIQLREYALKKGLSLSEYGIKRLAAKKKDKQVTFTNEKSFYNFLGLDWIPPELREGGEEILRTEKHQLPTLVELADIKGDLHVHTDIEIATSHDTGSSSLSEIVKLAEKLKYQYLGLADHNPKTTNLPKSKALTLLKHRKAIIDQFNYSSEKEVKQRVKKLFLFHSLEVDIKSDGSLALPQAAFPLFDFLIASVHSSFKMSKSRMTKRILKGLDHPKVKILGHPTGRMLGMREGYEVDWEKVFEVCLGKKIFLEINAWPKRLDLPDNLIKEAIRLGLKCVINSDSHHVDQLRLMRFGVAMARRGWAEKQDIINTLPLEKLKGIMQMQ